VLALLWSQRDKLSIKLIKRSRIWKASGNHSASVRDVLISDAELRDVDDSVEGLRRLGWITRAGSRVQEEMSWQIDGVADVRVSDSSDVFYFQTECRFVQLVPDTSVCPST
jgi:hypothetical protein